MSQDAAMELVLSAASMRGAELDSGLGRASTLPCSLFTKSPHRRMRVAFTCNVCGQRTTHSINPHAFTDGTIFVQCCVCNVYH